MLIKIQDVIQCSEARYWELFFQEAWHRRMILEGLGFGAVNVTSFTETPDEIRRDLQMTPKLHLPDAVNRALGSSMAIVESGRFARATRTWTFRHKVSVMTEKLDISGSVQTETDSNGHCRRNGQVNFEARIFGLGSLIERAAEGNTRRGFQDAANWTNRWLAENPQ